MAHKKGFTLIELLVVIAIIALLLAILMPGLKKAQEIAKTVVCASNMKQWGMIISFFANDNGGRFPDNDWNDDGKGDVRGMWWMLPLRPYYIDQPDILICRKASRVQDGKALYGTAPARKGGDGRYFTDNPNECWGRRIMESTNHSEVGEWIWASVAPNSWIMDISRGRFGPPANVVPDSAFWGKLSNIKVPSRVPIFLDSRGVDAWPHDTDTPNSDEFSDPDNEGQGYMRNFTVLRHNKSIVSVFGDGSVSKVAIRDLWKLKWHKDYKTNNPYTQDDAPWPLWMR